MTSLHRCLAINDKVPPDTCCRRRLAGWEKFRSPRLPRSHIPHFAFTNSNHPNSFSRVTSFDTHLPNSGGRETCLIRLLYRIVEIGSEAGRLEVGCAGRWGAIGCGEGTVVVEWGGWCWFRSN